MSLTRGWRLGAVAAMLALAPSGQAAASPPKQAELAERTEAGPLAAEGAQVGVTVTVILARKAAPPREVAPELTPLGPALARAFPDHHRFTRLGRHTLTVTAEGTAPVTLPNGSALALRHGGLRDGRHALQVEVGGLRTTAQVSPGATFFQAGRAHEGGMLVLAFEVAR